MEVKSTESEEATLLWGKAKNYKALACPKGRVKEFFDGWDHHFKTSVSPKHSGLVVCRGGVGELVE